MSRRLLIPGMAVVAACVLAGPAAAQGQCDSWTNPDGAEPPCNPYLADSPYATPHANNYAQASSPLAGPRPGERVRVRRGHVPMVALAAIFSPPYPDGRRAIWMPGISPSQDSLLYKLDERTGALIDVYHRTLDEGEVPRQERAISRTYGALDRDNRLIRAAGAALEVLGDARPGDRLSPIRLLRRFSLPRRALCRSDDFVVGVTMRYDGRVAFVTHQGMVGVVPREPERMTDAELVVESINGDRCADPAAALETTTNSIVADEDGGMYPLTNRAQYRFDLVDSGVQETWRAPYRFGTEGGGGVRQDDGSGSTPTLMGTARGDDRFVVVTDGQPLMHLVLVWRDRIPGSWKGLPGRDRRIACEHPITFGDAGRTRSQSEQSVVVRGYASFVPNNELSGTEALDRVPADGQAKMGLAGLLGGVPTMAPRGFERIDWDPRSRTCVSRWANTEVSIPNGVPFASAGSGLVYGIGQRNGIWGLEGLDMETGASRLWAPAGPLPMRNSFYAALSIGTDGSAWTGGFNGFTAYRPLR